MMHPFQRASHFWLFRTLDYIALSLYCIILYCCILLLYSIMSTLSSPPGKSGQPDKLSLLQYNATEQYTGALALSYLDPRFVSLRNFQLFPLRQTKAAHKTSFPSSIHRHGAIRGSFRTLIFKSSCCVSFFPRALRRELDINKLPTAVNIKGKTPLSLSLSTF